MKLTEYLAIWGAGLSTIVGLWNLYRDFIKRDRVVVTAGFRIMTPPRQEVFAYDVRNISAHRIKITHCAGYHDNEPFIRRLPKPFRKYFRTSNKAWLFSFNPLSGPALPATIEPYDYQMFTYLIDHANFPKIGALSVHTADGKEWFVSRRDIRAIHADKTYRSIHKLDASPSGE